jgi:hypothetical protein
MLYDDPDLYDALLPASAALASCSHFLPKTEFISSVGTEILPVVALRALVLLRYVSAGSIDAVPAVQSVLVCE